jgi:hypothetical protein
MSNTKAKKSRSLLRTLFVLLVGASIGYVLHQHYDISCRFAAR